MTGTAGAVRTLAPARSVTDGAWASVIRTPLLLLGTLVAGVALTATGQPWQAATQLGVLTFTVVNVVCLVLLSRRLRGQGSSIRELLGRWRWSDLAWGLLWSAVLYVPFAVVLMAVAWPLAGGPEGFGEIFAPRNPMTGDGWVIAVAAFALVFPFLNAPVEELFYRGYAQGSFTAAGRPGWALWIPAAGFAVQHAFIAYTLTSVLVYLPAFFVWGLLAAAIRRRQGRLTPLIVAHFFTNLAFSAMPLLFLSGWMGDPA